jgi:hypothetical protein
MSIGRVWIVCPVYYDVESFLLLKEKLLVAAKEQLGVAPNRVSFAVLDDSAGHDTDMDRLRAFRDVTVIEPPFNLGHQRAIVFGLRTIRSQLADTDVVITLDSDGEDRPEDLGRLIGPLLADPDDIRKVMLALRTKRRTTIRFKALYLFFRILFRLLTGTSVRTGNYAAYRGWLAKRMVAHPYFDLCYSSTLLTLNLDLNYVPCERGSRYAGKSRMGYARLVMHGLRMLMPFIDRITIRALLLFSISLGLAVVLSLVVIGVRVFSDAAIPGWATSTLLGIIILSFVALGNLITLFAVFSQSRGISLANIEQGSHARP